MPSEWANLLRLAEKYLSPPDRQWLAVRLNLEDRSPLQLRIDDARRIVSATVPWQRLEQMSERESRDWLDEVLAIRNRWECSGYQFQYAT